MAALDFPGSPSPGEVFENWEWDGTKWIPAPIDARSTPIVFFFPGIPASGFAIIVPIVIPLTIPVNFAGSWHNHTAAATAATTFTVQQTNPAGPVASGTVTINPGAAPTWTGPQFDLEPDDTLWMIAPSAPDATLAGPAFTILTTRG